MKNNKSFITVRSVINAHETTECNLYDLMLQRKFINMLFLRRIMNGKI